MPPVIMTAIVGTTKSLKDELAKILRPPKFWIVSAKSSLTELGSVDFPQNNPSLLIIEATESPQLLIAQIAALKQQHQRVRIILLGRQLQLTEIDAAFRAGINAYFAGELPSAEFLRALDLIVLGRHSTKPGTRAMPR